MGRKPNPLILEFFNRGAKLEDASNRYQHTCKACGENFPKGRIDSLTNHLVKKCPAITMRDRRRAILQFHELPDDGNMAPTTTSPNQHQGGQTMNLPFAPKQGAMSALETLAEVSRQRLDMTGTRTPDKGRRQSSPRAVGTQTGNYMDEFIVQDDRPEEAGGMVERNDTSAAPPLPSIYQYGSLHSPSGSPHIGGLPTPHTSGSLAAHLVPSLVITASAANELSNLLPQNGLTMEPELGVPNEGITDKYFHNTHGRSPWASLQSNSIDPMLQDNGRDHSMPPEGFASRAPTYPRPIAMNPNTTQTHFTTDFSMNQKPSKPKVRGRFTDSRRKEVQEVRKRGACIRCRMLKKPCSGENPCSTCVNVESARLWKQPCIRTRIADEFDLYVAGLYGVLSFHAVGQAKGQIHLDQIPGRIEATHYIDTATFATFKPLKCQRSQSSAIDPALLGNGSVPQSDPTNLEIVDSDSDDLCGKVELYIRRLAPKFAESEPSAFMRPTLATAFAMSAGTNKDNLLRRVLELWVATRILVDHSLEWHLFLNPSHPPMTVPAILGQSDLESTLRTPITRENNRDSYDLIKGQLMGAIEKSAAALSKFVMNDLERRLLQRQQANPFETFLVAVVLLACVERMCWLFKTWEVNTTRNADFSTESATVDSEIAQALQGPRPDLPTQSLRDAKWPLDKPPAYYSQQGERFSDILHMLLKMRGVPPKLTTRIEDGVWVAWGEDPDPTTREWCETVAMTSDILEERPNARFTGVDPQEWELKYISKIIRAGIQS
ncbi:hypothetical protein BU16DRAFT_509318 [Lophium mytilinum]|uniref:Zn(2)-C6 fungal-type domain-containing protein n=1 Tax=Lophium mytilinum TaxID=390894 RepID=A0A6A6QZ20_9PEZI|nr:hypothetical protein BU16DRAFT_509318 [Lophium mytilinum]